MTFLAGNHIINLDLLPENPIIVDAGACQGVVSKNIKELIPASTIYAIEPDKDNLKKLREVKGINVIAAALMGTDREIKYKPVSGRPEWGRISETEGYKVDTVTLNKFGRIDYLKMDIEGAELEVVKNLPDNIKQISMEVHDGKKNEIVSILESKGYSIELYPHEELYAEKIHPFKHEYRDGEYIQEYWRKVWYKKEIFGKLFKRKRESVLDVGAGNGRLVNDFKRYFHRVVGIDVSDYEENFHPYYNLFIKDNFEDYTFVEKFDYICFFSSFYQNINKLNIIKKAKDLLKEDGRIIIVEDRKELKEK